VVLHSKTAEEEYLPQLAIRPYPNKYVAPWTMKDKRQVVIRPIRPEDEPLMRQFHETLSDRSVYLRFLSPMLLSERVTHERLSRVCHCDYAREMALVVEGEEKKKCEIFAVGRLSRFRGEDAEARLSLLVSDRFQGQGIGRELVKRLLDIARAEKIKRIVAVITPENENMQKICRELKFKLSPNKESGMIEAMIKL
jgi:acetyltransferase